MATTEKAEPEAQPIAKKDPKAVAKAKREKEETRQAKELKEIAILQSDDNNL